MPIAFACPTCGREVRVSERYVGQKGPCPHCRAPVVVPWRPRAPGPPSAELPALSPEEGDATVASPPDSGVTRTVAARSSGRVPVAAPAGKRFGRFVLLEELGRGGMGSVHRAYDEGLRREVALKLVRDGADADGRKRFAREAEAGARLRHPSIVSVHDAGETDGTPWLVMDLVPGKTLRRRVVPGPGETKLSLTKGVEAVRDVARAAEHAHEQGVLHRDLKPENVIVDDGGRTYVLDFGLAKLRGEGASRVTRTGTALGTPAYVPPEQAAGEEADERSDVYGLGATLYFVLTGRPPFEGATELNVLAAVLKKDPEPPRTRNPRVSLDLETICLKALEKDPERRYASAGAFADELDRALAGEPIEARPIGWLERLRRRARRNKLEAALAIVIALSVVALGAGAIQAREARRREAAARVDRAREEARGASAKLAAARAAKAPDDEDTGARQRRLRPLLGAALSAKELAEQLVALAPDDGEARRLAFEASRDLGDVALDAEQWELADAAYARARELDGVAAKGLGEKAAAARTRTIEDHKRVVREELEHFEESSKKRREWRQDTLFQLVAFREPETVALVAAEVERLAGILRSAAREAVRAVAAPTEDEARAGQRELEGLEAALGGEEWLGVGSGEEPASEVVRAALRRLEARSTPHVAWRRALADAQGRALGPVGRELLPIACEALARAGVKEKAIAALEACLDAEWDEERAVAIGSALARLGGDVGRGWRRFGPNGSFARDVLPECGAPPTLATETAQGYLDRGLLLQARGDHEGAITDFGRAIELEPRAAAAWTDRGTSKLAKGDYDGAIADSTRVLELDPRIAQAWTNRANARQIKGDLDGAIEDHGRALELDPRLAAAWSNRANAKTRKHDFDGAIADASRALEVDPGLAMAWSNRANAKICKGDHAGAILDASRAVELDPRLADAWNNRAFAKEVAGDHDGAIADATRALELDPRLALAWNNRSCARESKADHDGALADASRALELDPRLAFAWHSRGNAREARGDCAGAIADYGQALELDPRFTLAWINRAVARKVSGDLDGAITDYGRALEIDPTNVTAWNNRANARRSKGDLDGALLDATRALELDPRFALAWSTRAGAKQARRDLDGAIADYGRAVELDPRLAAAWSNRAMARKAKGDLDGAIADASRALELEPRDPAAWINRANAKQAKGDLDGAISDIGRALELEPRLAAAWNNRASARREKGDLDGAIADASRALELNPRIAPAWKIRGKARRTRGELPEAAADFTRFLELAPNDPEAPAIRAFVEQQGRR